MPYVKYAKIAIGVAAVILVAAVVVFVRQQDRAKAPSQWIVQAATALNRSSISANPHWPATSAGGAADAASELAVRGQRLRVERRFAEARDVYLELLKMNPTNADAWAHLADCQAAAAGKDLTQGRDAIRHALAIDPRHRKALWLRASLELQEKQYTTAAATWRELEKLVPEGSSDARVIAANIEEADALARAASGAAGQGS